jgi:hypothetical protein
MAHGSNFKHYLDNDNNYHPPTPRCFMMEIILIHEENDFKKRMKFETPSYFIQRKDVSGGSG